MFSWWLCQKTAWEQFGLRSISRNVRSYSQNKSKLSVQLWQFSEEGNEHLKTILKLSRGTTKMAAYAKKNMYLYLQPKICLLRWYIFMRIFTALTLFIWFYKKKIARAQLFKANDSIVNIYTEWYANMLIFFAEKMWVAFAVHFLAKNIRILCIESAKTVNEMTLNELVKLTTLWTTGPSWSGRAYPG